MSSEGDRIPRDPEDDYTRAAAAARVEFAKAEAMASLLVMSSSRTRSTLRSQEATRFQSTDAGGYTISPPLSSHGPRVAVTGRTPP
jgi:hypothetical protein